MSQKSRKEQQRISLILAGLREHYPDAQCALHHRSPFELLVATILSAQCTDERVNQVTPVLFRRYPDPQALARARPEDLQEIIRSTGFFRNKTKSLLGASRKLVEEHQGKVPKHMEDLLSLPGVARKTANVVLGTAYGISSGIVVDTHVKRVSRRLGLTRETDPEKIEKDLMKKIPKEEWIDFSHRMIWHGRRICRAQKPKCEICFLADLCPYYQEKRNS